MSGAVAYHGGLAAEKIVADDYFRRGYALAATRWRAGGAKDGGGEIDLIFRQGAKVVFVEVKKSADFARAAESLSLRQMVRIMASASQFVAGEPSGQDTDMRFDLALVDGGGRTRIIENAFGH